MPELSELLHHTGNNFQNHIGDLDAALRKNLELLIRDVGFDRAAVLLIDDKDHVLRPRQIVTIHGEMEGEGETPLTDKKGDPFVTALKHGKEFVNRGEYGVYVPLIYNDARLGVLRVDNVFTRRQITAEQLAEIRELAPAYNVGIHNSLEHLHFRHQVTKLTTLTRIGTAIATTLKMNEVLELALSSLVKDLGYDRAQLFLLDEATGKIRENLSIDFRGFFRSQDDTSSVASFIESLLCEDKPAFLSRKFSANLVAAIPIAFKGKKTGVMIVDNLFTRQTMTDYDLSFLNIIADQLSTVIENSRLFEQVERLSITDSLTGMFNHRYFYERLSEEISRANRFGANLSLIMLDLDHFKVFNDTFGHQAGDTVLSTVSAIIQENIRSIDVASRYGGEEVAIILPGTDIEGARIIAERIRDSVRKHDFRFGQKTANITVSIGLVCYPVDSTIKSELVRKADHALYWVKNHGRDGICAYSRCEDL